MNNSEYQINKQLNKAEEQQEINHIHWLLTKNSKNGFFHVKNKEEDISQWVSHRQEQPHNRKRPFFSLLKNNDKDKSKKYSRYLNVFNQTQSSSFYKYENLSSLPKKQEEITPSFSVSPKKLNLKLSIPSFIEQYSSNPEQLETKKISLPLIKKLLVPVNFFKNGQRKQPKGQQEEIYPMLVKGKSQSMDLAPKEDNQSRYRKGKMMGCTKKGGNGLNSNNCKSLRNSLENNKLKDCITFIKS